VREQFIFWKCNNRRTDIELKRNLRSVVSIVFFSVAHVASLKYLGEKARRAPAVRSTNNCTEIHSKQMSNERCVAFSFRAALHRQMGQGNKGLHPDKVLNSS
jgi:hypothetical protein